jgi:TRAP transporter TAXI family solute receptor
MQRRYRILAAGVALCFMTLSGVAQLRVASGIEGEIYHQFARDIKNNTDVELSIQNTRGSLENFEIIRNDKADLAFTQMDVLMYEQLRYPSINDYLKLFFPLYAEEIHIVSRNTPSITNFYDLKDKRVAVGAELSGTYITAQFLKMKTEIRWTDVFLPADSALSALINDSIDALILVSAAPSNLLKSISAQQRGLIKLIPIYDKRLDDIYQSQVIASGTYAWQPADVQTYTVRSLLLVNTRGLNEEKQKAVDIVLGDIRDNLKTIQRNKLSHPKWKQVDFSNADEYDWPQYGKQTITAGDVFNVLAIVAVFLTLFQIYFMLNKLWIRKHEKIVAESISVSGLFISILINSFFAFKNILIEGYPQLIANAMWIVNSAITILIGIGFWVSGLAKQNLWVLLRQALKLERSEAGDLAKSFFRPSSAEKIIDILGQVAMIDDELAEEEKAFIKSFADAWSIPIDWNYIQQNFGSKHGAGFQQVRDAVMDYLSTSPPEIQVSQLGDLLKMLINADDQVTEEEQLIMEELSGIFAEFLGDKEACKVFKVAVVPQDPKQEDAIAVLLKDLKKQAVAGGYAFLSEPFYSERYAEVVCERYRSMNVFTVVIQPDNIKSMQSFIKNFEE